MSSHPQSHGQPTAADDVNGSGAANGAGRAAALTSPLALRQLVLNYLVHNCYTETALAFANDGVVSESSPLAGDEQAAGPSALSSASASQTRSPAAANGNSSASGLKAPANPIGRGTGQLSAYGSTSAHPLSAPPLSRDDSSMEVEVDQILSGSASAVGAGDEGAKEEEDADAAARQLEGEGRGDTPMESAEVGTNGKSKATNGSSATGSLKESSELSHEEIANARLRKEIRDHILTGRIRQAIDLCNANFPSVLNVDGGASLGSQAKGAAKGSKGAASGNGSPTNRRLPSNPTSLDPQHLFLNLQIQSFIETVRSAATGGASGSAPHSSGGHLGSSSSGVGGPVAHNTPGIAAAHPSISRAASPAPSSTSSTGSVASTSASMASGGGGGSGALNPAIYHALAHAQRLYALAQSLNPPKWRALYLKELESVTALLAYTDVETSPISKYLDQSRRMALAEQLNSAIMYRAGHAPQPLIESAVRQTSFLWAQLAADKVAVPITPSAAVAAVGSGGAGAAALLGLGDVGDLEAYGNVPPIGRGFNEWIDALEAHELGLDASGATSGADASRKVRTKVLPPFDLARFLGSER